MSHLSTIRTEIKDLTILERALSVLGGGLLYAEQDPTAGQVVAMDGRAVNCLATVLPLVNGELDRSVYSDRGHRGAFAGTQYREWGVQLQEDGTYTLVGDLTYPRWHTSSRIEWLRRLGWEWELDGMQVPGLLSEYAVQTGYALAYQHGFATVEVPAGETVTPATIGRPSLELLLGSRTAGARTLLLTGGYLPPHLMIVFTANPDGTSSVALDGGTDSSCYEITRAFESSLGAVLGDVSLLNTAHVYSGGELVHLARG